MYFLHLTLLYCMLNVFCTDPALQYQQAEVSKSISAHATATTDVDPISSGIILQSKDGGQTWEDISVDLPENIQPEGFFAGESELYLHVNNTMYRSKSNLNTPVWERVNALDPASTSIAFNPSGVMAFNYQGQIFKKASSEKWLPAYAYFKKQLMRTIFETTNGTLFVGCDNGLYKSADKGKNWKRVIDNGWVMEIVESNGVLIGTNQQGIIRSADNGEHWEWVINEGGVGIAVERIKGGFAAISYNTRSQTRRVRISLDSGKTWKAIDDDLPPSLSISSIKQAGNYLLVGHPDGIFHSSDMGKTWNVVHAGIDSPVKFYASKWNAVPFSLKASPTIDNRKVFKIYISGSVVYAVAVNSGC